MNEVPTNTLIPIDDLKGTWDQLAENLDSFIAAWDRGGPPPDLEEFLPKGAVGRRRLVLIELIKTDLEYRFKAKAPVRIEDYVARFPELSEGGIPIDLLFEEYHVRRTAGESVKLEEYGRRFPGRGTALAQLIDRTPGSVSTSTSIIQDLRAWSKQVATGARIDEFQILRSLGKGSFAQVYLAWQPSMQRTVALKVSADRGTESQTLAQFDHPNIVRVFDQRLLPEEGTRLLYMSFVAGGTLSNVIEQLRNIPRGEWSGAKYLDIIEEVAKAAGSEPGPRTAMQDQIAQMTWPDLVAWLGARMAVALHYAHGKGVIHRDIKPANILLTPQGQPQLADFNVGSASLKEPAQEAIFGGSLPYMSPEHLEAFHPDLPRTASDIDARSDVYELGMTLWELLTGERPFVGESYGGDMATTVDALLRSREGGVPTPAYESLPDDCPDELASVLSTCLEAAPTDRYATAEELAQDLELCHDQGALGLLRPHPGGWREWVRRSPALWISAIGLAPNAITTILNVHYNHSAVISTRLDAEPLFWLLVEIINGVFFPVGIGIFVIGVWPLAKTVKKTMNGVAVSDEEMTFARKRSLRLGSIAFWTCVACWVTAGTLWPILLDVLLGRMPLEAHAHFFVSLAICGTIAAVYPFFIINLLTVRAMLPVLLRNQTPHPSEINDVNRLEKWLGRCLLIAAAVPLVGVAAMVTIDAHDRLSMLAVTFIGLIGCVMAYRLERGLRSDLEVLKRTYFLGSRRELKEPVTRVMFPKSSINRKP